MHPCYIYEKLCIFVYNGLDSYGCMWTLNIYVFFQILNILYIFWLNGFLVRFFNLFILILLVLVWFNDQSGFLIITMLIAYMFYLMLLYKRHWLWYLLLCLHHVSIICILENLLIPSWSRQSSFCYFVSVIFEKGTGVHPSRVILGQVLH